MKNFIPGLDLKMMYREMYLAAEGYLREIIKQDEPTSGLDPLMQRCSIF